MLTRLAVILAGHVVVLGLLYAFTVHTVTGRELADASLRGAISVRPLVGRTVDSILDFVSVASLLGAVAVVAVIALIRLARLEGLAAIGILVGANISTWLLKNVLLVRPDLGLDEVAPATLNSLPSGHATAAFSAVAALVFVVPSQWRDVTATVGAGYAALAGLATMLAGWHRTADSVAAFLVVGAWTAAAAAVVVWAAPGPRAPGPAARPASFRWLGRFAIGSLTLGFLLTVGLIIASLSPSSALGSGAAFLAGGLFVAGAAAAVTCAVLEVVRCMETANESGATEPY